MPSSKTGAVGVTPVNCRELLDALGEPVLIVDSLGRIAYANDAAQGQFGSTHVPSLIGQACRPEVLFGRGSSANLVSPDGGATEPFETLIARRSTTTRGQLLLVTRENASRVELRVDALPIHTEFGTALAVGLVFRDITEEAARRTEAQWLQEEILASRRLVERELSRTRLLKDVSGAAASSVTPEGVGRAVLASIAGARPGTRGGRVMLQEGDEYLRVIASLEPEGDEPPESEPELVPRWESSIPEVRAAAENVILAEGLRVARGETLPGGYDTATDWVVLPMRAHRAVIGTLTLKWDEPAQMTPIELETLALIADTLGQAVENARLFEAEHHVADELQGALLSLPDRIPGIEFAHAYHSATDATRVGGDFYDIFELNQDHVGITIGDVAGKGLEAAVLTALAKNTVRAHASERGKTPSRILSLTNEVIFQATPAESFVTIFFGILDCRDGRLLYANAGHTSAMMVKADGTCTKLAVTGPILGAFQEVTFEQDEACLDLDEVLFLYTDGLTEARRNGEFYGDERLLAFLPNAAGGTALHVVEEVVHDVLSFSGGRFSDDLAALAVKRVENAVDTPQQQKLEI